MWLQVMITVIKNNDYKQILDNYDNTIAVGAWKSIIGFSAMSYNTSHF